MEEPNKRRAQRFPMALPVAIKLDESGEAEAKTKDISSSGVYFEFSTPIDIGSRWNLF